jgi:hypothetical protein
MCKGQVEETGVCGRARKCERQFRKTGIFRRQEEYKRADSEDRYM